MAMKKIIVFAMTMLFVLALGTAYAADNGVTDFTGRSYDTFEIGPVADSNSMEGVSAGGLRADDSELGNGVTDFSGRAYDTFEIGLNDMRSDRWVERESAGGLRASDEPLYNGTTDFSGKAYDRFDIAI
jgi:hypothetical protein